MLNECKRNFHHVFLISVISEINWKYSLALRIQPNYEKIRDRTLPTSTVLYSFFLLLVKTDYLNILNTSILTTPDHIVALDIFPVLMTMV